MKINNFEEGCEKKGLDPVAALPDVSKMPERYQAAVTAFAKLIIMADAAREKDPDWNDGDEEKYYPWFDMKVDKINPTGFRFRGAGCGGTHSSVGSWLSYDSDKDTEFHAKTHMALYRDMMVIPK